MNAEAEVDPQDLFRYVYTDPDPPAGASSPPCSPTNSPARQDTK